MTQNRTSGAAGNAFGSETAPLIAVAIGAQMLGAQSNEAVYKNRRVVIKCARPKTTSVGVTYLMLDRVAAVIGAFQQNDGSFKVVSLPAAVFRKKMRDTRSTGASKGRVGLVGRAVFESAGSMIRVILPRDLVKTESMTRHAAARSLECLKDELISFAKLVEVELLRNKIGSRIAVEPAHRGRIFETETAGLAIAVGHLQGKGGGALELWCDHYVDQTMPRFYYGFHVAPKKLDRFEDVAQAARSFFDGSPLEFDDRDLEVEKKVYRLKRVFGMSEFDRLVVEKYPWSLWCGIYSPYRVPLGERAMDLAREAANYFIGISRILLINGSGSVSPPVDTLPGKWEQPDPRVEKNAVSAVKRSLRKWKYSVVDRQRHVCGYDLEATRMEPPEVLRIEVKGTKGEVPHFFISPTEYAQRNDPRWRLAIVTTALTSPECTFYKWSEVEEKFEVRPYIREGIAKYS